MEKDENLFVVFGFLFFLAVILSIYHFASGKTENTENTENIDSFNILPSSKIFFEKSKLMASASPGKCPYNPWAVLAERRFGTPAKLLECIRYHETRYGCSGEHGSYRAHDVLKRKPRNYTALKQICAEVGCNVYTVRSSRSGALGPYQYLPATWQRYVSDGDGDGIASPFSLADATFTAANHLRQTRDRKGSWRAAIRAFNHSYRYTNKVLECSRLY